MSEVADFEWNVSELATGTLCASGYAAKEGDALNEMTHYALIYGQDGPVSYWLRRGDVFLFRGSMDGVTIQSATTKRG